MKTEKILRLYLEALLCSVSMFLLKCSVPVGTFIFKKYLMGDAIRRRHSRLLFSLPSQT